MLKLVMIAAVAALLPGVAIAEDWGKFYAEVYGGALLGTESTFNYDNYAMDASWAAGAAFGIETPVPGFSLGLDFMKTGDAAYSDGSCCSLSNFSVMAEGEYAIALNETFSVYGALGLGAINVTYAEAGDSWSAWGPGYSAALGVRAEVTDGLDLFAEVKHTDTFDDVSIGGFTDVRSPNTSLLTGLRVSF